LWDPTLRRNVSPPSSGWQESTSKERLSFIPNFFLNTLRKTNAAKTHPIQHMQEVFYPHTYWSS
jgi:hypothetical protein